MFKEFTVEQIFRLENPKGKLTTKQLINGNDIPYVAAKKTENGIAKWCSLTNIPKEQIMKGNCIVFIQQGDGSAGYTTYQPNDFYAISCVCCGYIDNILDEKVGIYLMSVLDKNKAFYNHSNGWNSERLRRTVLSLPVISHPAPNHEYTVEDIDWQYMRDRIRELERDRIRELDAYLKVTGLNDYELNEEDKAVLCMSDEKFIEDFVGDVIWKKIKVSDLFDIYHGKRLAKSDRIPGNIPFLTAGETNQGVAEYIGNKVDIYKSPITIDMFGNCFYHDGNCSGDDNIYFFVADYDKKIKIYISSVITRTIKGIYSYSKQFRQGDADNLEIELPFTSAGELHKIYIYIYIRAIEKTVIKEMIVWKNRQLEILRKIV